MLTTGWVGQPGRAGADHGNGHRRSSFTHSALLRGPGPCETLPRGIRGCHAGVPVSTPASVPAGHHRRHGVLCLLTRWWLALGSRFIVRIQPSS